MFDPNSHIIGGSKVSCTLCNCKPFSIYQQTLRKICHVVTKAEHEVTILYEFGKC